MSPYLVERKSVPFQIRTYYELLESGPAGKKKPLYVYLHGYKQNIHIFKKKMKKVLDTEGYHVFINGPYPVPIRGRKIEEWGAAWYLYDGDQQKFVKYLDRTASCLEQIITDIQATYQIRQTMLIGYSMGGYQAGFTAINKPHMVQEVVSINARFKEELINKPGEDLKKIKFWAIHGIEDKSVDIEPQRASINSLKAKKMESELIEVKAGHKLNDKLIQAVKQIQKNLN